MNSEHIKILLRGVHIWNEWRKEKTYPYVKSGVHADLSGLSLTEPKLLIEKQLSSLVSTRPETDFDLQNADFSHTKLNESSLVRADLTGCNFNDATCKGSSFIKCDFSKAEFRNSKLFRTDFNGSRFNHVYFVNASIEQCWLNNTHNKNANFSGANLINVHFESAVLDTVYFKNTIAKKCNFTNSSLSRSSILNSYLHDSDLTGSSLFQADFSYTSLNGAVLTHADLTLANLYKTDLSAVQLEDAKYLDSKNLNMSNGLPKPYIDSWLEHNEVDIASLPSGEQELHDFHVSLEDVQTLRPGRLTEQRYDDLYSLVRRCKDVANMIDNNAAKAEILSIAG